MRVYPERIKIIPSYITFKLKEIPCGVSFSQKKKDKQDKILETRKQDMLTKSNTGRMSQLSMVSIVESKLDTNLILLLIEPSVILHLPIPSAFLVIIFTFSHFSLHSVLYSQSLLIH